MTRAGWRAGEAGLTDPPGPSWAPRGAGLAVRPGPGTACPALGAARPPWARATATTAAAAAMTTAADTSVIRRPLGTAPGPKDVRDITVSICYDTLRRYTIDAEQLARREHRSQMSAKRLMP